MRFERLAPGNHVTVESNRIRFLEQQVAGEDNVALRNAHYEVCRSVAGVMLDQDGDPTQVYLFRQIRSAQQLGGIRESNSVDRLAHPLHSAQV